MAVWQSMSPYARMLILIGLHYTFIVKYPKNKVKFYYIVKLYYVTLFITVSQVYTIYS